MTYLIDPTGRRRSSQLMTKSRLGSWEARRRSIRIPQDLSVVGFDDTFLASRSAPPLTTVAQPLLEMGRVATRSLAQMITNDVVSTHHIELATRLVVRDSTAPTRLDR